MHTPYTHTHTHISFFLDVYLGMQCVEKEHEEKTGASFVELRFLICTSFLVFRLWAENMITWMTGASSVELLRLWSYCVCYCAAIVFSSHPLEL